MANWFLSGLFSRVVTTRYPASPEIAPGTTPGRPVGQQANSELAASAAAAMCPVGAIGAHGRDTTVNLSQCVHCQACRQQPGIAWQNDYQWAAAIPPSDSHLSQPVPRAFKKSLHIRIVDGGSCDSVLNEIKQLGKPFYNMHKLGFFITPSPRHADVLMLTGPVTRHMEAALKATYDAMPHPKWVIAVGSCAISGCVFGSDLMTALHSPPIVPIDVVVPGCPPPPLAILHGLMILAGREGELPAEPAIPVLPADPELRKVTSPEMSP